MILIFPPLAKSYVPAHIRKLADGRVVLVSAHHRTGDRKDTATRGLFDDHPRRRDTGEARRRQAKPKPVPVVFRGTPKRADAASSPSAHEQLTLPFGSGHNARTSTSARTAGDTGRPTMTRKYYLAQSARATPTGKFPFAVEAVFDSKEGLRQYLLSGKWKAGWSEDEIPALIDSLHVVAASGHINPGKHIPADKVVGWNRLADSQDPEIRALAGRPAKADDEQQTTAHGLDVDHVPATDRMHGRAWRHFVSTVETAPDRPSQTLSGGKALAATPFGDDALIPANATVDQYRRALRQVRDPAAIDFRDAYPDALDDLAKVPWR